MVHNSEFYIITFFKVKTLKPFGNCKDSMRENIEIYFLVVSGRLRIRALKDKILIKD